MLTTNKSHCLSIGKFRRRVNSPPGKPGGPFIIAGSFASLRMTGTTGGARFMRCHGTRGAPMGNVIEFVL